MQWVDELPLALAEFHRVLNVGGLFSFTTFGPDTLSELRRAFAAADASAHVNRFLDMHDVGDMLVQAGFADPVMDMEMITMTYADAGALMRDLKAIGAQNARADRRREPHRAAPMATDAGGAGRTFAAMGDCRQASRSSTDTRGRPSRASSTTGVRSCASIAVRAGAGEPLRRGASDLPARSGPVSFGFPCQREPC